MQKKKEYRMTVMEIIIIIILVPLVFVGGYMSLGTLFMGRIGALMPNWFFTIWGVIAILAFDVLWIIIVSKFWPQRKVRLKIFLTVLILTLSLSALLSLWIVKGLAESMH